MTDEEIFVNPNGRTRRAPRVDYSKVEQADDLDDDLILPEELEEIHRSKTNKPKIDEEDDDDGLPKEKRKYTKRKDKLASADSYLTTQLSHNPSADPRFYTERGYDTTQLPIRQRYGFSQEFESDGSPVVQKIIGRRPLKQEIRDKMNDASTSVDLSGMSRSKAAAAKRRAAADAKRSLSTSTRAGYTVSHIDYEYFVKYKGVSYLHCGWYSDASLISLNKGAKGQLSRFLKKLAGPENENGKLEDPEVDIGWITPEKILDVKEEETMVDMSEEEIVEWEKEAIQQEMDPHLNEPDSVVSVPPGASGDVIMTSAEDEELDEIKAMARSSQTIYLRNYNPLGKEKSFVNPYDQGSANPEMVKARQRLKAEDPLYEAFEGSLNPYADGLITGAPVRPRTSFLLFQILERGRCEASNVGAANADVLKILADEWQNMEDEKRAVFNGLMNDETRLYAHHQVLYEKAQTAAAVWQPIRRCLALLDHLCSDTFSHIFLDPIDLNDFPDYEEVIERPVSLWDVRERVNQKKYPDHATFIRDLRRIWQNCKVYNGHGTGVWHTADYMSKMTERLYEAWVLEFKNDAATKWCLPCSHPWEPTCRACDGECKAPDHKMVLCDHCDANYNIDCLEPSLASIPPGIWHCPRCRTKDVAHLRSAAAESVSRRKANEGEVPQKPVMIKKYLVNWKGLGYADLSWETEETLLTQTQSGEECIATYIQEANVVPVEPALMYSDVDNFASKYETSDRPASWPPKDVIREEIDDDTNLPVSIVDHLALHDEELKLEVYAQARAYSFLKFGEVPPQKLAAAAGMGVVNPSLAVGHATDSNFAAVFACVNDMVDMTATNPSGGRHMLPPPGPALFPGEKDVLVPVTRDGMLAKFRMDTCSDSFTFGFSGHKNSLLRLGGHVKTPLNTTGPLEASMELDIGECLLGVNGTSVVGMPMTDTFNLIKAQSADCCFVWMRFLKNVMTCVDPEYSSMGKFGVKFKKDVMGKFSKERKAILKERAVYEAKEESLTSPTNKLQPKSTRDRQGQKGDSDSDEFMDDGDDDDDPLPGERRVKDEGSLTSGFNVQHAIGRHLKWKPPRISKARQAGIDMFGIDMGESSDEDVEGVEYYVDGVKPPSSTATAADTPTDEPQQVIGTRKRDFTCLPPVPKFMACVALSKVKPDAKAFESFPDTRALAPEAAVPEELMEIVEVTTSQPIQIEDGNRKKGSTKVAQMKRDGTVMHTWANVQQASLTLNIAAVRIKKVLAGSFNGDNDEGGEAGEGDTAGGFRWKYVEDDAIVDEIVIDDEKQEAKEYWKKLYDHDKPHDYKDGNKLRDYQVDGVNWMASCWYKRHGCILADEMGLGKTVQIVSYIEHLYRVENNKGPFLVVVPLSTIEHWRREFAGWTTMNVCVYHDKMREWRDVMREYEWYYPDRPRTWEYLKFNVMVTTYDTLIGDFDIIEEIPFRSSIVDEAHRLRNQKGKLLEIMKTINDRAKMEYGFQHRILMTGTPLQNNMDELWTLLNFVAEDEFDDNAEFFENYGNLASQDAVEELQNRIGPYMLRRVKEDVAKDIPSKEETVIDVELTATQKTYYRAIFEHNHGFLTGKGAGNKAPKLMNVQMELRKCCNHPFLLEGVEEKEGYRVRGELEKATKLGHAPDWDAIHEETLEQGLIMSSGKMVLLDKLLPKLRREGHKVLIFSQMVRMLDVIADYCDFRDFNTERLDGRVNGLERQKAIDRFNVDNDSFCFLLSTRAGGVGINLTAADTCIIFDSDWNPQNDVQAQARCHRIGQTKEVKIYRLITSNCFEQEMFNKASMKLGLEQAVLGTYQTEDDGKPTGEEMEQMLKRGAYALLTENDDEAGRQFCEDDIESILEKRTRTRVVEGAKTNSWLNKSGFSAVNRIAFTGDGADGGVNVDDPEFWSKVMPEFINANVLTDKLKDLEKTMRKEAKVEADKRKRAKKLKAGGDSEEEDYGSDSDEEEDDGGAGSDEDAKKIVKKAGRGRPKKQRLYESDEDGSEDKRSRATAKKATEYIEDLGTLMEEMFKKEDSGELGMDEKDQVEQLLMTCSVMKNLFNREQMDTAQTFLSRLQGDRRRKVRDEVNERDGSSSRRGKRGASKISKHGGGISQKRKRRASPKIGADGYLMDNSDDEVGVREYDGPLTKSEAAKRYGLGWGGNCDDVLAAALFWPFVPPEYVQRVLTTAMQDLVRHDQEQQKFFSELPSDVDFPDYYQQIERPMCYSMMLKSVVNYSNGSALQNDLRLIMANSIQYYKPGSDVVKEAQEHAMVAAKLFKESCLFHGLYLQEDGTPIEVLSDDDGDEGGIDGDDSDASGNDGPVKSRNRSNGVIPGIRRTRCRECKGCTAVDCGKCTPCRDKPKFGGKGALKQACIRRKCTNMVPAGGSGGVINVIGKKSHKKKVVGVGNPMGGAKKGPASLKERFVMLDMDFADWDATPLLEQHNVDKLMLREKVAGYSASMAAFKARGVWKLPGQIAALPDALLEVMDIFVDKLLEADEYQCFSEPISDSMAPGYSAKVTGEKSDFGTIKSKLQAQFYSPGDVGVEQVWNDVLLVLEHVALYNLPTSEIANQAAIIMEEIPMLYCMSCLARTGENMTSCDSVVAARTADPGWKVTEEGPGVEVIKLGEPQKLGCLVYPKPEYVGSNVGGASWAFTNHRGIVVGEKKGWVVVNLAGNEFSFRPGQLLTLF